MTLRSVWWAGGDATGVIANPHGGAAYRVPEPPVGLPRSVFARRPPTGQTATNRRST